MPRRTKEEAEQTRLALIKSALQLFSEKGVAHTTLMDISKAAGVTKGAFYWHFKNKLEVLEAITQEYALPLDEAAQQKLETMTPSTANLIEAITFYFETLEQSEALIAFQEVILFKCEYTDEFSALLKRDKDDLEKAREIFSAFITDMDESQWQGPRPDAAHIEALSQTLLNALVGGLFQWLTTRQGILSQTVTQAVRIILRGGGLKVDG
ncbi:TetR family transcriptional regulator [Pseudoalteromonas rubra]|uniref:HTH tetR-type domain-containing protein n=1 Tax=Pseudoalteromonas rubra TaxID=43658 RepID=A0A5S3WY04_9GAMM|nr:TetR family transcriptional regulator [Pseudoalteromonas rubra]TMP36472.1 hypothetical protein CWB98_12625 [Pseudoalteromonas rubra]